MSEVRDFHPVVAQWLTANGYEYRHHVRMPIAGVADFVATKDGQTFVVECKVDFPSYRNIIQVLDYCSQIDGALPMIVRPVTSGTFTELCRVKGVTLVLIDMPEDNAPELSTKDGWPNVVSNRMAFLNSMRHSPESVIAEVIAMHDTIGSCALLDLWQMQLRSHKPEVYMNAIDAYIETHPEYSMYWDALLTVLRLRPSQEIMLLPHLYIGGIDSRNTISQTDTSHTRLTLQTFAKLYETLDGHECGLLGLSGTPFNLGAYLDGYEVLVAGLFDVVLAQDTINRAHALVKHLNSTITDEYYNEGAIILLPYQEYRAAVDSIHSGNSKLSFPIFTVLAGVMVRWNKLEVYGFYAIDPDVQL